MELAGLGQLPMALTAQFPAVAVGALLAATRALGLGAKS